MSKSKRLNDTAAVKAMPVSCDDSCYTSKSIRKIDNGYVTSTYGSGKSTEVFTPEHPDKISGMDSSKDSMSRAVQYMKQ